MFLRNAFNQSPAEETTIAAILLVTGLTSWVNQWLSCCDNEDMNACESLMEIYLNS